MALTYEEIRAALGGERLPAAFVDLDAFDRNLDRHLGIVGPRRTPLRVATKSVRVVALLRQLLERGGEALRGLLCYSAEEADFLAGHGFDDLLVAYPPWQVSDLERVARLTGEGRLVSIVADGDDAVARIGGIGSRAGVRIRVVLCVDMSLRLLGRVHVGVRRSPLRTPDDVLGLARRVAETPGVELWGLLAYEAQVAGLADDFPGQPAQNAVKSLLKRVSVVELGRRRTAIVRALVEAGLRPRIVNGGGVGSLDTTTPESGVTEVTAGSGFFKPHLYDHYRGPHMRALEPAAFFALEVTRRPAPEYVTCLGGGYVASGPPGADKVPLPWLPAGLSLLPREMAGEVQTPLRVPPGVALALGDPVVFRHAKAGELAERFTTFLLLRGGRVVDRVPTYRGEGKCFF